ncbi:MAG: phosphoenolpyruvate--protein phosphotransferase [SAR86 cluster bacterium]|uniref:phosphoenolpyruvate--protein phosphotransferase n=1 Tax=SAR86 cluster bacterium TaxID=2030880 RepID=A0A2A5CJW2_9GAMM|nr:MAG: phosphoenolpyruvate--protein phosphotransferase [SAR86 cluster bacterium]
MLDTLRSIIQEVNGAKDLNTSLDIITKRVQRALDTKVCSVYLLDQNIDRYVLMASIGLDQASVGKVSLGAEEGLVGFVALRAEPVNLDNASSHPRYVYLPETREEQYESFLGVPIIHHQEVLGVLVVQQQEKRIFDSEEEAFLITLSAQLAGVIANAEARGAITGFSPSGIKTIDVSFDGVPGAPGIAIAQAVTVFAPADLTVIPQRQCKDIKAEIRFFNDCLNAVRVDISELKMKIKSQLRPEERELFDAYLHMLSDQALGNEVVAKIKEGSWAQGALASVALEHVNSMELIDDDYLRERATDIKDLCSRVLFYLQDKQQKTMVYPDHCILVCEELSAAMLADVPKEKLAGILSAKGSGHSHVAILARGMGVPAVMGVIDIPLSEFDGKQLIIDGYNGKVYGNPSEELLARFQEMLDEQVQLSEELEAIKDLPAETLDKHRIELWVNIGMVTDSATAKKRGAEGIGLFRTEVPFLLKDRFPTEREQTDIYRPQLEAFRPNPVIMRTLDIGGDKALPYFKISEENPFLGWRGIRVSMDHPEIFISQVRAMMKASQGLDNLQIMLPMISNMAQVDYATHLIDRGYSELLEEGLNIQRPDIGVMIEVPAITYQMDALAKRVNFISVGTNDLVQYLLAVDRNNPRVANLFSVFHPSVLQVLNDIAKNAERVNLRYSVCGEMAGDPGAAILLMAMGYKVLSMNITALGRVKSVIRNVTMEQAKLLLAKAMQAEDSETVKSMIDMELYNAGVERLLRSAKA